MDRLANFYVIQSLPLDNSLEQLQLFIKNVFSDHHKMKSNVLRKMSESTESVKSIAQHPDLLIIKKEKKTSDYTAQDLNELWPFIEYRPLNSQKQFIVIPHAEQLTDHSANKMLKILEDTPAYVCFFLITSEIEKMLPTIISRAVRILQKDEVLENVQKISLSNFQSSHQSLSPAEWIEANWPTLWPETLKELTKVAILDQKKFSQLFYELHKSDYFAGFISWILEFQITFSMKQNHHHFENFQRILQSCSQLNQHTYYRVSPWPAWTKLIQLSHD
jgi:hypothetical protein